MPLLRTWVLAAYVMGTQAACGRFGYDGPRLLATLESDGGSADAGEVPSGADAQVLGTGIVDASDGDATADGGSGDASLPDAQAPDAASADAGCILGDWEPAQRLDIGGTSTATLLGGPGPSSDRRTLFFSMQQAGAGQREHLWVATRTTPESSTFANATNVSELNTPGIEGTPFLTADSLTLYFFADPSGMGTTARQLYSATRTSTSAPFGSAVLVPNVNDPAVDQTPRLTRDGLTLVWSSTRPGGAGHEDLYLATRPNTTSNFTLVRRISELATSGRDQGGSFTEDKLTLFFVSPRTGTLGGADVWSATRPDATSPFATPVRLNANVNSASEEFDSVLSTDGMELFFTSDRGGQTRLWHSLRHCVPP